MAIGKDSYPFPFPILAKNGRWQFNAAAGKTELIARRIGENELNTAKVLLAIVDAQLQYASKSRGWQWRAAVRPEIHQ